MYLVQIRMLAGNWENYAGADTWDGAQWVRPTYPTEEAARAQVESTLPGIRAEDVRVVPVEPPHLYTISAAIYRHTGGYGACLWETATRATVEATALPALLGVVQTMAQQASQHGDKAAALFLQLQMPGEENPVEYRAYLDDEAGPLAVWDCYVVGGLMADGSGGQAYPNPVAAALALGAQAMALLLNP